MAFEPYDMTNPAHADAFARLAVGIDHHRFEAASWSTGHSCTRMVERDGGGDQCGLPADHPLHRGFAVADWVEANLDITLEPWQRTVIERGAAGFTTALPRRTR